MQQSRARIIQGAAALGKATANGGWRSCRSRAACGRRHGTGDRILKRIHKRKACYMIENHGTTYVFREKWIIQTLIFIFFICFALFFTSVFIKKAWIILAGSIDIPGIIYLKIIYVAYSMLMFSMPILGVLVFDFKIINQLRRKFIKKFIVLEIGSTGVKSYCFHGIEVHWGDLCDAEVISINAKNYYKLNIILILRKNSRSWLAIQRKWIFWDKNIIRIPLDGLPAKEQVQAALALRANFAYYGGQRAARLMQGVRQIEMQEAFESFVSNIAC